MSTPTKEIAAEATDASEATDAYEATEASDAAEAPNAAEAAADRVDDRVNREDAAGRWAVAAESGERAPVHLWDCGVQFVEGQ